MYSQHLSCHNDNVELNIIAKLQLLPIATVHSEIVDRVTIPPST